MLGVVRWEELKLFPGVKLNLTETTARRRMNPSLYPVRSFEEEAGPQVEATLTDLECQQPS